MKDKIRIIFIEDNADDVDLGLRELKKEGFDVTYVRVETENSLIEEIENFKPDIVISDYSMPSYDGKSALNLINNRYKDIPVIIFTGSINEETAVECMKLGASDYILKERTKRLPFAVKEALEKKHITIEKQRVESSLIESNMRFIELAQQISDIIYITDINGIITYISPATKKISGYEPSELISYHFDNYFCSHEIERAKNLFKSIVEKGDSLKNVQFELKRKDGGTFISEINSTAIIIDNKINGSIGVLRDITERIKSQKELIQAKESAEKANKLKDTFIANISHEIRTPLNGILGITSLLHESLLDRITNKEEHFFHLINVSSKRLIRTIDMIVNFSRIRIGDFKINPVWINPENIINQIILENIEEASRKGLKIDFANDCENIEILFDEYSFTNSVSQLINNAIKFSNKGEIKVSLFIENNQLKINVKDDGIGISKEFENEVFEPYTQEDIGYNRSYEGIGLGLSLSQKLMTLSGSKISFVSQKGKGSVFTININQNVEIRKIENNKDIEMNDADINQKQKQLNILVVEDDFSSQELIKMILQKLDHKVLFAYNAQDAEELLKKNKFDVIFMDISLRGSINGLQFTKQIKKDPKFADIPVIAVTAHAFEADKIASLEAGCSDVIIKPLRKIEIENVLKKYT